jgi:peptide/nickel transport system permease protein
MIRPELDQEQVQAVSTGAVEEGGAGDFDVTREIGYYELVWRRLRKHRLAMVSTAVLLFITFISFVLPHFLPAAWDRPDLGNIFSGPSVPNIMGTDELGRDIFKRILEGGQVSLRVGFLAMLVTIVVGGGIGFTSGFFGGLLDNILMRVTDAMLAIPIIFLLILISAAFQQSPTIHIGPISFQIAGASPTVIILAIGITSWPYTARIIRSVVLSLKEKEFVEAARAVGSGNFKIMSRHLFPNALGPIVVSATLTIGTAIILESTLSYLGYGIGPPIASWGSMLFHAQEFIWDAGYYALFPGLMILITVLCINFIGDGLRDAFDPRSFER